LSSVFKNIEYFELPRGFFCFCWWAYLLLSF